MPEPPNPPSNLPAPIPPSGPIIDADPSEAARRKRIKFAITIALLLAIAGFCAQYAWELSDVKPNIIYACALWLFIYGCLAAVFWMWSGKLSPKYKCLAIVGVLALIVLIFRSWAVEQYRSQHSKSTPSNLLPNYERRFLGELDDPVERVFRVIRLLETNAFSSLRPVDVGLFVTKYSQGKTDRGFRFRIQDGMGWIRDIGTNAETNATFDLSTSSILPEGNTNVYRQKYSTRRTSLKTIAMPIALWSLDPKPFRTIRDFHNGGLLVYLSPTLTGKVERIEFVVNAWTLLQANAKGLDYRLDFVRGMPFEPEVKLWTLLAFIPGNRPPTASSKIDIHEKTPEFAPQGAGPLSPFDQATMIMEGSPNLIPRQQTNTTSSKNP